MLAKFFDGGQWAATLNNARSTVTSAVQGYLWGNLAAIALAVLVLLVPRLEPLANQVAIVTYCIPLVAIGPVIVIVAGRSVARGRFGRAGRDELLLHHGRRLPARAAGGPAGEHRPRPRLRRHRPGPRCARCS